MEVGQVIVYICVYLLSAATLFSLAALALLSNPRNRDNQVVAAIPFLYSLLFFAEFIRHLLPISYSPIMVNMIFGNIGLIMLGVSLHMYIRISRLHLFKKIPFYPYILYVVPLLLMLFNVFGADTLTNSEEFHRVGYWLVPDYNAKYYGTMIGSIVMMLVSLYILTVGIRHEKSEPRIHLLKFIRKGSAVTLVAMLVLGLFSFGSFLPPHSYILMGLVFSLYLVIAIYKHNLIPSLSERYRTIFELNPNALVILNQDLDILELNQAAYKNILRFRLKGDNLVPMFEQLQILDQFNRFLNKLNDSPLYLQDTITVENRGEVVHMRIDGAIMSIDSKKHYAINFRDMTSEIENAKLANRLAYRDSLTNLANRALFIKELEQLIVLKEPHAVLLIDLNHFKQINDIYGHLSGDEVLRAMARLLEDAFPKPHLVARLGGDEFTVILKGVTRETQLNENINFIRERGKQFHVTLGSFAVPVEFSVGGAHFKDDDTLDELLMRADEEMYKDKYKDRSHERNSFK